MLRKGLKVLCSIVLSCGCLVAASQTAHSDEDADVPTVEAIPDTQVAEADADKPAEADERRGDRGRRSREGRGRRGPEGFGRRGRGPGRGMPSAKDIFKRIDGDGDGSVSFEEFEKSMDKFRERMSGRRDRMRERGFGGRGWRGRPQGPRGRGHGFQGRRGRGEREGRRGGRGSRDGDRSEGERRSDSDDRLKKLEKQIGELQKAIEKLTTRDDT